MASNNWKKVENEAGYPTYIDQTTEKEQYDHPHFLKMMESLEEYNGIKYSAYRIAFKMFTLQRQLRVPPLRISSGVFARHQLSLSESSLSLDTAELEAVLGDIYFAAAKEGLFTADVDLAVDLLINLLLNVYDKERKEPVRVLAAKTLLIILSEESVSDKWAALANCCADHNGCVSPRRLAALLTHVAALPTYLGSQSDHLQNDVDACFDKSAGMLGVSVRTVAEWGAQSSVTTRWLPVTQRVIASRNSADVSSNCAACAQPLIQVLKFKCIKCNETYFCEKCYLYDKDLTTVRRHKKSHLVHEIIDGEMQPTECLSFIKSMRKFFFCTTTKKKKSAKKCPKKATEKETLGMVRRDGKPAMFTSTVGKASGHCALQSPMYHEAMMCLETQLSSLHKQIKQAIDYIKNNDGQKTEMESYCRQISDQINNLKEGLSHFQNSMKEILKPDKTERPQAFDLFSPIPVEEGQSKVTDLKTQPRVLSLDSGNFSVTSKQVENQNLLTVSGDALKPVVIHATSDSISTVSMNDISSWYNDTESLVPDKRRSHHPNDRMSQSITATERQYAADIRHVETTNDKIKQLNANLDIALDSLQQLLTNNLAVDDSSIDNTQLRETANEMEGLLGTLIRGVEQRATLNATKGLV